MAKCFRCNTYYPETNVHFCGTATVPSGVVYAGEVLPPDRYGEGYKAGIRAVGALIDRYHGLSHSPFTVDQCRAPLCREYARLLAESGKDTGEVGDDR